MENDGLGLSMKRKYYFVESYGPREFKLIDTIEAKDQFSAKLIAIKKHREKILEKNDYYVLNEPQWAEWKKWQKEVEGI